MQSSATDPPPLNGSILKDGSGLEARGAMARKRHKPKLRRVEVLRGQGRTMAPDRRFRAPATFRRWFLIMLAMLGGEMLLRGVV